MILVFCVSVYLSLPSAASSFHWLCCCCVVSRDDDTSTVQLPIALSLEFCYLPSPSIHAGTICFLFPCCKRSASPSYISTASLSPPALITYHLGHTLAQAISSKPAFAQHAPVYSPLGGHATAAGPLCLHGPSCSMGSSGPTVNVTLPSTCPACTCGCSCRASLNLACLVDEAWLCGSATHGPLPRLHRSWVDIRLSYRRFA